MSASKPPASCRWADLPLDLLGNISTRLRNLADFVRFHAICRPWRDLLLHTPAVRPTWLLGSRIGLILHSVVDLEGGTTASSTTRRVCDDIILPSPRGAPTARGDRNWVASEDGTAAQLFTWRWSPRLIDLVTGAVTPLPLFPREIRRFMENPHGVIYNNGTIFLYSFVPEVLVDGSIGRPIFTAAVRRPGDAVWTFGTKKLNVPQSRYLSVAYHDGMVVLCVGKNFWCVWAVHDLGGEMVMPRWNTSMHRDQYIHEGSYVLECCGKLMWASIQVERGWYMQPRCSRGDLPPGALLVTVDVLEETSEGGEMGWVARDGRSLGDRVLFLGSPASFAVDAVPGAGGCAYFMYDTSVFRYSFVDGEAKLLEQLSPGWGANRSFMWLRPQLTIAPIQEIQESVQASKRN
ncbi:unnamed protein product [Alopecurus aequalis]